MSDHLTSMRNEVAAEYRAALATLSGDDARRRIAWLEDFNAQLLRERNALAARVKAQRDDILTLIKRSSERSPFSAQAAIDAIRARADEDGALHFDAIREVLVSLGARP